MKKLLFVLVTTVFLFGCSSDDATESTAVYNPPTWIQGTWGLKADANLSISETPLYKFTTDNFCQITNGTNNCWKELVQLTPQLISGSDTETASTYEVKLVQSSTNVTITLLFKKVSATKIIWVYQGDDIELEKLK